MIQLTFNTEYERIGAEDIIGNIITVRSYSKSNPDDLTINYYNVPQATIDLAQSLPDWQLIDAIGRQITLEEYVIDQSPEIFRNASDKLAAAIQIQARIQEIATVDLQ